MPAKKTAAKKDAPPFDFTKVNLAELKKRRLPFLAEREKNRAGKNDPRVEEVCNSGLRALNTEIQQREAKGVLG